jgi:hypothetical protein
MLVEYLSAQAYTPFLKVLSLRIWAFRRRLSFSFSSLFASSSRFFFTSRASWSQQQGRQSTAFYPIIYIYIRASQPNSQLGSITIFDVCMYVSVCVCVMWIREGEGTRKRHERKGKRERIHSFLLLLLLMLLSLSIQTAGNVKERENTAVSVTPGYDYPPSYCSFSSCRYCMLFIVFVTPSSYYLFNSEKGGKVRRNTWSLTALFFNSVQYIMI